MPDKKNGSVKVTDHDVAENMLLETAVAGMETRYIISLRQRASVRSVAQTR